MTSTDADLIEAQLAQDEIAAEKAPTELDWGEWPFWIDTDDCRDYETASAYRDRFPPARMHREVAAKREIIRLCAESGSQLAEELLGALAGIWPERA